MSKDSKELIKAPSEILEAIKNSEGFSITAYISKDGFVWAMIINAMQTYSDLQSSEKDKRIKELEGFLTSLDYRGGLGYGIHNQIKQLLTKNQQHD